MAVMAEFLVRGYNVAIPEVDIGDDIFVVRDSYVTFSDARATCFGQDFSH